MFKEAIEHCRGYGSGASATVWGCSGTAKETKVAVNGFDGAISAGGCFCNFFIFEASIFNHVSNEYAFRRLEVGRHLQAMCIAGMWTWWAILAKG